jgi:hypothetical protein
VRDESTLKKNWPLKTKYGKKIDKDHSRNDANFNCLQFVGGMCVSEGGEKQCAEDIL